MRLYRIKAWLPRWTWRANTLFLIGCIVLLLLALYQTIAMAFLPADWWLRPEM